MKALGYEPSPPSTGTRAYILWHIDGKARELSVYQEGTGLLIDSKPLLPFALTLPGATAPKGTHARVKWAYSASLGTALDVAKKFRAHADK